MYLQSSEENVFDEETSKKINTMIGISRSPQVKDRLLIGSVVLDILRNETSRPKDIAAVLEELSSTAKDPFSEVRCVSLKYIPHMAMILSDPNKSCESLRSLITSHLLPIITTALSDEEEKVVELADVSLITLLEHCLVPNNYVKDTIWPAFISKLQMFPSEEACIRVINMMSKMVPWVGCDTTESLFVPLFCQMCSKQESSIREVCASIIGDFCAVVSLDTVESLLIPNFVALCIDEVSSVRKMCAEVFMSVSSACSTESRRDKLTPMFAALLADPDVDVQFSAFCSLGPFITTFAQPSITNLGYNHKGELVLKHPDGFEFNLHACTTGSNKIPIHMIYQNCFGHMNSFDYDSPSFRDTSSTSGSSLAQKFKKKLTLKDIYNDEEVNDFSEFSYWRNPIPELEIDPLLLNSVEKTVEEEEEEAEESNYNQKDQNNPSNSLENSDLSCDLKEIQKDLENLKFANVKLLCNRISDSNLSLSNNDDNFSTQSIVPQELIKHFVSISGPFDDKYIDDLAHHCAYNLPAVALTLGPENWSLLKNTYSVLAADKQWKVRRIVASSIHELAVIVGEEVATEDLVPVFNDFITDLDEVRIGALKHLGNFLKSVRPSSRNSILSRLTEFLKTDYEWNWRFRAELGEQLLQIIDLFPPQDTSEYLTPVVFSLLQDKVAHVRTIALRLVTEVIIVVNAQWSLVRKIVCELAEQFAHSSRWSRRQTFAHLCARIVDDRAVPNDLFARDILPHLLDLSWDKVPNVRLAVARTLSHHVMTLEYFSNPTSPHHEILMVILKRLQSDKDRDVRALAHVPDRVKQKSEQSGTSSCPPIHSGSR